MHCSNSRHGGALLELHTGSDTFTRPAMGSWINYGLGSENDNLPGFITINPPSSHGGSGAWSSAFLPAKYGGTMISGKGSNMNIPFIKSPLKERSQQRGRSLCERLKNLIPRQQFKVAIQAAIGGKIIARETVASFRKDVTQKLYGGDVTRKNKLLDKQKKGKKRMRQFGKVDIPQNAFLNALKMNEN